MTTVCWLAGTEGIKAGREASKGAVKGRAIGADLDVKPSAPTSVPLRVRFGNGTPTGAHNTNSAFAQGGSASR